MSRTRLRLGNYYVPDVAVVAESQRRGQAGTKRLETYDESLPLVVEVWSPSTGEYDVTEKLAGYRERGDAEIWLIHPYERTITTWRRTTSGYDEARYTAGEVPVQSLPGVLIKLESLFR
jgi:Uma2 family endonuclease